MRFKLIKNKIIDTLQEYDEIHLNNIDNTKIVEILNKLDKKNEYQTRVINKCISIHKKYEYDFKQKTENIKNLNQEKQILKKIIKELNDNQRK